MSILEHRIPPPVLVVLLALAMWGASRVTLALPIDYSWRVAGATAFLLVGAVFGSPAFVAFRRARTTIDPVHIEGASTLVTGGIFRISRNPMYVGLAALLFGWAAYLAAPWAIFGPVFFVLFIDRFQIVPEERAMLKKFGTAYEAYRREVRRWI